MSKKLVLAFDIERSGGNHEGETIGIGASVVDSDLNELDRFFFGGYMGKGVTKFEERCYQEFWSKHLDTLEILRYQGEGNKGDCQLEMINEFMNFRRKWEVTAKELGVELELVTDNNVYDGGFINQMILYEAKDDYDELLNVEQSEISKWMPIPYTVLGSRQPGDKQKFGVEYPQYKSFWETHSEQRGLLMAVDPAFKGNWGFGKRIRELYCVPPMIRPHDHNPANDAYTIAFEQQVMLGIRDGRIVRRGWRGWWDWAGLWGLACWIVGV